MATKVSEDEQNESSDGYSDMPLNTRQQNAIQIIKSWQPVLPQHIKCIATALTVVSNVLYKPKQEKFHKLRLSKAKVKKTIVDVVGGIKLLKLAGFSQKTENKESILYIEPPSTIEELEQLTDIWLVLLKTDFIFKKGDKSTQQFKVPNTLSRDMQSYFETNEIAQSADFQTYVQKSNDLKTSPTALQRYDYFGKAIQMLLKKDANFFNLDAKNGLNDIDVSDVAAMIVSEIFCGYYDEDAAYKSLIYAEDARIIAEKQKEYEKEQNIAIKEVEQKIEESVDYKVGDNVLVKVKDDELRGCIKWIGTSSKWSDGTWFGVELESENLIFGHNGYFNGERFFGCSPHCGIYIQKSQIIKLLPPNTKNGDDNEEKEKNEKNVYTVIDIGCGWGNFGRLLMDKSLRPYLDAIEQESELKKLEIFGYDISKTMIDIAQNAENDKFYQSMNVLDCKRNELKSFTDGSVDVIVSCNCLMQNKEIGHPDETFLIEAHRLLADDGWLVVTRRFNGIHLGMQLYAYLMIAQQLGWKNVFASRVREVFFIGWQKIAKK